MEILARRAILDQRALNYDTTSSDLSSCSPASLCSSISLYSYNSDMDKATFTREAAGRRYNAWRNSPYLLPSDQPEFARQSVGFDFWALPQAYPSQSDQQHRMLQLAIGGLYPDPNLVESVLAPQPNERTRILDLGWYIFNRVGSPSSMCVQVQVPELGASKWQRLSPMRR